MTNLNTNIILTIIKVFLLISICAFFTTFYALQNENKIENLYEKIEKLRSSNVDLNDWSLTFSGNYSDLRTYFLIMNQKYNLESNSLKDFNYCTRIINAGRSLGSLEWFFENYKDILTESVKTNLNFDNKLKLFNKFNERIKFIRKNKIFVSDFCTLSKFDKDRNFLIQNFEKINNLQNDFITTIQELKSQNFRQEQFYYKEIKDISERSSNIYLTSFLIQIFLSLMIVLLDLYTNRGTNEK